MIPELKTHITYYSKKTLESFNAVHLIFLNKSTGSVRINDHLLLAPGETLDLGYHPGAVDTTRYRFQFSDSAALTVIYKTIS